MKKDRVDDYLPLRRKIYGVDRLALPRSLTLTNPLDRSLYHQSAAG